MKTAAVSPGKNPLKVAQIGQFYRESHNVIFLVLIKVPVLCSYFIELIFLCPVGVGCVYWDRNQACYTIHNEETVACILQWPRGVVYL